MGRFQGRLGGEGRGHVELAGDDRGDLVVGAVVMTVGVCAPVMRD